MNQKVAFLLPLFSYDAFLDKVNRQTFAPNESVIELFYLKRTYGHPYPASKDPNAPQLFAPLLF